MSFLHGDNRTGTLTSPQGFMFGVEGFDWGKPKITSITFFLDNTVGVFDQHGRPIKGITVDGKEILFAPTPPINVVGKTNTYIPRPHLGSHQEVVDALQGEGVDWTNLPHAGVPQIAGYKPEGDKPKNENEPDEGDDNIDTLDAKPVAQATKPKGKI